MIPIPAPRPIRVVFNRSAPEDMKPVPVSAVVNRCREKAGTLGRHHPDRNLLLNCATALEQMVDLLGRAEDELEKAGLLDKLNRST